MNIVRLICFKLKYQRIWEKSKKLLNFQRKSKNLLLIKFKGKIEMARLYSNNNQKQKAIAYLEESIKLNPNNSQIFIDILKLEGEEANISKALDKDFSDKMLKISK